MYTMARKTFCYDEKMAALKSSGEIDKNSHVLKVILSFTNSQETNNVI